MKKFNARQEKFAQLVAQGIPASQAYLEAGYSKCKIGSRANGCLLLKIPGVAARIAEIRALADSLESTLLTIIEKRRFLAELVRTPIGCIGPDSWLCQEFREEVKVREHEKEQPADDGETDPPAGKEIILRRRVRVADKLRAIALDSKLAGHITKPDPGPPPAEASAGPKPITADEIRQGILRLAKDGYTSPFMPRLKEGAGGQGLGTRARRSEPFPHEPSRT